MAIELLAVPVILGLIVFLPPHWFGRMRKRINPPSGAIRREMERKHRELNGRKIREIVEIDVPPDYFNHLVLVGPCSRVDYQSMKEKQETEYRHKFGEESGVLPNAYTTLDGKCIVIIGGNFEIRKGEDGIAWIFD